MKQPRPVVTLREIFHYSSRADYVNIKALQDGFKVLQGKITVMDMGLKEDFDDLVYFAICKVLPSVAIGICKEKDKTSRRMILRGIEEEYHPELFQLINHYWDKYEWHRNK